MRTLWSSLMGLVFAFQVTLGGAWLPCPTTDRQVATDRVPASTGHGHHGGQDAPGHGTAPTDHCLAVSACAVVMDAPSVRRDLTPRLERVTDVVPHEPQRTARPAPEAPPPRR